MFFLVVSGQNWIHSEHRWHHHRQHRHQHVGHPHVPAGHLPQLGQHHQRSLNVTSGGEKWTQMEF